MNNEETNTLEQEAKVGGEATNEAPVNGEVTETGTTAAANESDAPVQTAGVATPSEVTPDNAFDTAPAEQTIDLEVPADVIPHAKYRVIGTINITDGQGQVQGTYPIGSVHAFSVEQGEIYVQEGLAEEVTDEA